MKYIKFLLAAFILVAGTGDAFAQAGTHHAGDACTAKEFGTTELDVDQTGIIGCFRSAAGANEWKWKFTGGGGFGQCYTFNSSFNAVSYQGGSPTAGITLTQIDGTGINPWTVVSAQLASYNWVPPDLGNGISDGWRTGEYNITCRTGYTRLACGASHTHGGANVSATSTSSMIANGCKVPYSAVTDSIGNPQPFEVGITTMNCCKN